MTALALFSLLNAVWQGVVLVALVALALRLLPRGNAATTCAIWTATYFLVATLPLVDFVLARPVIAPAIASVEPIPPDRSRHGFVSADAPATVISAPRVSASAGVPRVLREADVSAVLRQADVPAVLREANAIATRVAVPALALWIVAALALLGRLGWSYVTVLRLKRAARRIDVARVSGELTRGRRAELGVSPLVRIPCAIGFLHPMIVLPATLADTLDPADLARIVVHEHAHLRRYDDWTNALQRIAAAVFFFHPALYYAARRIELDREVACDDEVVDTVGEPIEYAECLTKIVGRHVHAARLTVVPGFFFGRSQVIARVDRLIALRRSFSPRVARYGSVAAAAILLSALALARLQVPVIAASAHDEQLVAQTAPAAATSTTTTSSAMTSTAPAIATASAAPKATRLPAAHHSATSASAKVSAKSAISASSATTRVFISDGRPMVLVKKHGSEAYVVDEDVQVRDIQADVDRAMRAARRAQADAERQVRIIHVRSLAPIAPMPPMPRLVHVRIPDVAEIQAQTAAAVSADVANRVRASVQEDMGDLRVEIAGSPRHPRVDLLDALAKNGYGHPSVDELIALANHGITGEFVDGMSPLLGTKPTVQQLIALADQGIGPTYVRGMADAGYPHLAVDQLVKLRNAGVTPHFVKRLSDHGYHKLSVDQLVKLAESGI